MGLLPTTAASAALGVSAFINAGLGLRADFFFAGFFAAAFFFAGFLAAFLAVFLAVFFFVAMLILI
jgi:hypothetical protein